MSSWTLPHRPSHQTGRLGLVTGIRTGWTIFLCYSFSRELLHSFLVVDDSLPKLCGQERVWRASQAIHSNFGFHLARTRHLRRCLGIPTEHVEARAGAVGTIFCLATRVASTVRAMSTSATESNSIGFIGGGMMATALMNGFLKGKAVPSAQAISVSEPCTCARLNPTRVQSPV